MPKNINNIAIYGKKQQFYFTDATTFWRVKIWKSPNPYDATKL